jgi:hypothetical protein
MKLNENVLVIEDFHINKMEELEALDYIKKKLIPYAVDHYDQLTQKCRRKNPDFNFNDIRKQLKKTGDYRNTKTGDYIEYKSHPFTFFIRKDYSKGWINLTVGYNNLTKKHEPPYPFDIRKTKKINESKYMDAYGPGPDKERKISRLEEDQAVRAIKIYLVPIVAQKVSEYLQSKYTIKDLVITPEMILKTFRKIQVEPGEILYIAPVWNGQYTITFIIEKNVGKFTIEKFGGPKMYIGYHEPNNEKYRLFDLFPGQKPVEPSKSINESEIHQVKITEVGNKWGRESDKRDFHLTKMDEQRALEFLRNEVFPFVIKEYSLNCKETGKPIIHYGPEETEIRHSLRKLRKESFPTWKIDRSIYIADFKSHYRWVFLIEKEQGVIRAGYVDDEYNDSYLFDINFSISDPFKRQAVHISPVIVRDYVPGKGLVNEVHSKGPYQTITKKEEEYAFQQIKQNLVPHFVKRYNDKWVTKDNINHNLKKNSVYYWPDGNIQIIFYVAMLNLARYYTFMVGKSVKTGYLRIGYSDPHTQKDQWFSISGFVNEGVENKPIDKYHLTKEDIDKSLQFIRNLIFKSYGVRPKNLKRIENKTPSLGFMAFSDHIRFSTDPLDLGRYFNFVILKIGGKIYVKDDAPKRSSEKYLYPLDYIGTLNEGPLL